MFGWERRLAAFASRRKRASSSSDAELPERRIFTATWRFRIRSFAR